ncbi:MAG: hypothetical protein J1F03_06055 [Oscillospiraceae bacterium]|nr:hypothetical protein [Oscillospiraceae bacterium]
MIYIKKQLSEDVTVQIRLTEDDEFYTCCAECGQEVKATEEILDDFGEFLVGGKGIICEECVVNRNSSGNGHEK